MVSPLLGKLLHQYEAVSHIPQKKKYARLENWLKKNQSSLIATFPGSTDENMQVHFSLQGPADISDAALTELQGLEGIEGVFRKPEDSLPG